MSNYVLENNEEAARLEKQSTQSAYQLKEELSLIRTKPGDRILDCGCGTGLVARFLADHTIGTQIEGCDFSATRIENAREQTKLNLNQNIRYFETSLDAINSESNRYDLITCRYVIEHLSEPEKAVQEFYRVLKNGGKAYVINFDGVLYNLFPMSTELNLMMEILKNKAPFDLYAGRKIPELLKNAGFKNIQWNITAHSFQGEDLLNEYKMNAERLTFAIPLLSQIFGSETKAYRFKKIFLEEMMKPAATLFYNKFVVTGEK